MQGFTFPIRGTWIVNPHASASKIGSLSICQGPVAGMVRRDAWHLGVC